ncbi:phosphopantetheine adenylyltransferase [Leptospira ryugenii]|nr:phosphopantetheine adenylyltransferase [Leptospira ryugenii]
MIPKDILISLSFIITGIIHALPVYGAIGNQALEKLYGLPIQDPNLLILLRHRAILFGIVSCVCFLAAFEPNYRNLGFLIGYISVLSFLWMVWQSNGTNEKIQRVFAMDIVALLSLVVGNVFAVIPFKG